MPLRALRPVGSYVPLWPDATQPLPDLTCGGEYVVRYLDSGTSALSQALTFVRLRRNEARRVALLPAYGCPDLIAAATYAGVKVNLVDTEPETPWLSLNDVRRQLDKALAIVAVHFLGMRERIEELAALTQAAGIPLIEDSAQMAPFAAGSRPTGDLVVYSFGRGKPLSLLTGGALLVRRDWADEFARLVPAPPASAGGASTYTLKCLVYNTAVSPHIYSLVRRLPFLHLGQVAYHAVTQIEAMNDAALAQLGAAFARLPRQPSEAQQALKAALASNSDIALDLAAALGRAQYPLLRYPVLLKDGTVRDRCLAELDRQGLGASPFYARALQELPGLPAIGPTSTPNASSFAARLLTLPVHADVTRESVTAIIDNLARAGALRNS